MILRRVARLVAAAALLVTAGCAADPQEAEDGASDRAEDRPTSQAPRPSSEPGAEEPGAEEPSAEEPPEEPGEEMTGGTTTVPVYFVGDTERAGPRLYREFQRVEGDPLVAAAAQLTDGSALDPDYRTLFPGGGFADVTYDDGTLVATVADDGWSTRAAGMSRQEARVASQQLVYTLQGVQQERAPVEVRDAAGRPVPLFGIDTAGGLRAASPLSVLSHVNLTTPAQGDRVGGSLQVSGVGNSFEASVGWSLRRAGREVDSGAFQMAGWMDDKLFPFEETLEVSGLAPGRFTFWVTTDDPTGGTEGVGAMTDDKEIVIR